MRPLERNILKFSALTLTLLVSGAVLFPIFAQAKSCSKCVSGARYVRRLSLAMLVYSGDHDGSFAPRDVWADAILPYVKSSDAFRSPSPRGAWGYAFNGALDHARMSPDAARVPMVYDSVNPTWNASDLVASLPAPGRWRGWNAIAYADGSVRMVPAPEAP